MTDRSGNVLLDITEERTYSSDAATRQSTLHWLGDRKGYISASAVSHYAGKMAGFDLVSGVYDSSGEGGEMTLTLSARVQNAALDAMAGRKGTVGVYNYKTGEILCALTTPTYDPDNVPDIASDTSGQYDGVYNRPTSPAPFSRWSPPPRRWTASRIFWTRPSPAMALTSTARKR